MGFTNTCFLVLYFSVFAYGQNNDSSADTSSRMDILVKNAVSNNTALLEVLNGGENNNRTEEKKMRSLTVSALGTPSLAWNDVLDSSQGDSVPVIASKILESVHRILKMNNSDKTEKDSPNYTSDTNTTSDTSDQNIPASSEGISIPLERLSRRRRQAAVHSPSVGRRRVLLLLNPSRNNTSIDRSLLLGPGLLLLRNNDSLPVGQIVPLRSLNPQRQVPQIRNRNRSPVVSRQPAIQQIDLRNINLTKETSQNVSLPTRNLISPNATIISGRTVRRNLTNLINNEALLNNISRLNQIANARRQLLNSSRRSQVIQNGNNTARRTSVNGGRSNIVRRPIIEPRLALQQPVRSRRIALLLRPNATTRGVARPAVRRTLLPTARRRTVTSSSNRLTGRTPPVTRRRTSIGRTNIRRTPSRTRPRPTRRRVVRPVDPFTRRFSAGFQRGSNLLNEPPEDEIRGFDGSVSRRENAFGQNNVGGPFGAPRQGRGFMDMSGGFGPFGSPFL